MSAIAVLYHGTPGRNPATDTHPIPGLLPPLEAGKERVIDDAAAQAAGGTNAEDFTTLFCHVFNGQRTPPILTCRPVGEEEARTMKLAHAAASHAADPRRAAHEERRASHEARAASTPPPASTHHAHPAPAEESR